MFNIKHKFISEQRISGLFVFIVFTQVKDAELEQFYMDHKLDQELLQKFFIIRLVLAPVIEEIILLDRLLYLHEQVSYIVPFNSALSFTLYFTS